MVISDPRPLRELFMDWLRGYKKPIGTPQDSVVYAIQSLNIINPDHIPGSSCPKTAPTDPDLTAPQ